MPISPPDVQTVTAAGQNSLGRCHFSALTERRFIFLHCHERIFPRTYVPEPLLRSAIMMQLVQLRVHLNVSQMSFANRPSFLFESKIYATNSPPKTDAKRFSLPHNFLSTPWTKVWMRIVSTMRNFIADG